MDSTLLLFRLKFDSNKLFCFSQFLLQGVVKRANESQKCLSLGTIPYLTATMFQPNLISNLNPNQSNVWNDTWIAIKKIFHNFVSLVSCYVKLQNFHCWWSMHVPRIVCICKQEILNFSVSCICRILVPKSTVFCLLIAFATGHFQVYNNILWKKFDGWKLASQSALLLMMSEYVSQRLLLLFKVLLSVNYKEQLS